MALTEGEKVGKDCKLYYNTGTHAAPSWVLMGRVRDVSVPLSKGEADVSRRESGWRLTKGALKENGLEFGYVYKSGTDTVFDMLLDSFLNDTAVEYAVMDDLITESGAQGLRCFMEVFEFPYDQALEEGQIFNVSLKGTPVEEASTLVQPDWYEIP
jgi:hypothetical protein